MILVYIAGSFRAATAWEVEQNVRRAEETAFDVLLAGAFPVVPHANTRYFHGSAPEEHFVEGTLELLRRCDAVLLVEGDAGRSTSSGTNGEVREALRLGTPVFATAGEMATWMEQRKAAK